jgi:predicted esterase
LATTSIPRDVLSRVINGVINPKSANDRLKLVRFYMQAERFQDAEIELQQAIKDFPNLADLADEAKGIRTLRDERLLSEVEVRRKASQHQLAYNMLANFPTKDVAGTVLQEVRDKLEEYDKLRALRDSIVGDMNSLIAEVKDTQTRRQLRTLVNEIADNLSVATVDRLAAFHRLAGDQTLLPEQRLALAVSGWLIGGNEAVDNIQTALSLAETRNLVHDYLRETEVLQRRAMLESLGSQQGNSPKRVAAILAHMKPPIDTPQQLEADGYYKLEIRGIENEPDVTYYVQLPPEYDPYVKYPTIVTLHGAMTSAEQQIDWWAGESKEKIDRQAAEQAAAKRAAEEKKAGKAGVGPSPLLLKGLVGARNAVVPPAPAPDPAAAAATQKPAASNPPAANAGGIINPGMRFGQATRQGYIVIAPAWTKPHQYQYEYSAREHAAVLGALRDATRRFSIDTDRVYLSGHSMGGDAAWDIGLAHPDLWAGVIPIVATTGKLVDRYWKNAEKLPLYFVSGELDGQKTVTNAPQWERYFSRPSGWDMTLVEYQGRGHENFSDEIQHIFDWMPRKRRNFYPKEFSVVTMRTWDNFFWGLELSNMPANQMVDPASWPPPRGTLPMNPVFKVLQPNGVSVDLHSAHVTLWLSPDWVNFDRPITIRFNSERLALKQPIKPSLEVMLEDVRTRGDRQHPFWAKVEQ